MSWNVLLIEADAAVAEEIRAAFGPAGFVVSTTEAGESALERTRAEPPDLILLSAELPDMSGFSVCNRLKRALPSTPLVLYTREATDGAIEAHRASKGRADAYLRAPLDMADLMGRAAQLLQAEAATPPPSATPSPAETAAPPPAPASARPPPAPPPRPTVAAAQPVAATRLKTAGPRADQLLAEWPRDPAPPKGTPEEKLEYFRERLRVRDAYMPRLREAINELKAEAAQVIADGEELRATIVAARSQVASLETRLDETAQELAAAAAQRTELERRLAEVDATRQSLSEVLSETMQEHERAEQQWSARVAAADAARAEVEQTYAGAQEAHVKELQAIAADRADERAAAEEARVRGEADHAQALAQLDAERLADRESARTAAEAASAQLVELAAERDGLEHRLADTASRLATLEETASSEARLAAETRASLEARLSETEGRAALTAGELADVTARAEALEQQLQQVEASRAELEAALQQTRDDLEVALARAGDAERSLAAREDELGALRARVAEQAGALEAGRTTAEGVRGALERAEAGWADATHRAAEAEAEGQRLAAELEATRAREAEARDRVARLELEVARLAPLEPVAAEAVRLRKELPGLKELVQQRTQAAEASSRAAQSAANERAKLAERLSIETGQLQSDVHRLDGELAQARRKLEDAERVAAQAQADLARERQAADQARGTFREGATQAEQRHAADLQRLKATAAELERHLEGRTRVEHQLKRRIGELEAAARAAAAAPPPTVDGAALAALKARVAGLENELTDLREENDFLNGEVARYTQKNRDLSARLGGK
jgi:chromosome segregation ATPase/DNA-binding NarL/FixJ family response regulator